MSGNKDRSGSAAEFKTVDNVLALKERIEEGRAVAVTAAEALKLNCREGLNVVELTVVCVSGRALFTVLNNAD